MRTLPAILSGASELTIQFPAPDTGVDVLDFAVGAVYVLGVAMLYMGIIFVHFIIFLIPMLLLWNFVLRKLTGDTSRIRTQRVFSAMKRRHQQVADTTPRVGYKQAFLMPPEPDTAPFRGVLGVPYYSDDQVPILAAGFHAFADKEFAEWHIQQGNVLLEVLLSGHIEEHELGYIATQQRVLQIIPQGCYHTAQRDQGVVPEHRYITQSDRMTTSTCPQVTHFATLFKHRHKEHGLMFLCDEHADDYRQDVRYEVYPLDAIYDLMPWLEDEQIIVTAQNEFVPTAIPDA